MPHREPVDPIGEEEEEDLMDYDMDPTGMASNQQDYEEIEQAIGSIYPNHPPPPPLQPSPQKRREIHETLGISRKDSQQYPYYSTPGYHRNYSYHKKSNRSMAQRQYPTISKSIRHASSRPSSRGEHGDRRRMRGGSRGYSMGPVGSTPKVGRSHNQNMDSPMMSQGMDPNSSVADSRAAAMPLIYYKCHKTNHIISVPVTHQQAMDIAAGRSEFRPELGKVVPCSDGVPMAHVSTSSATAVPTGTNANTFTATIGDDQYEIDLGEDINLSDVSGVNGNLNEIEIEIQTDEHGNIIATNSNHVNVNSVHKVTNNNNNIIASSTVTSGATSTSLNSMATDPGFQGNVMFDPSALQDVDPSIPQPVFEVQPTPGLQMDMTQSAASLQEFLDNHVSVGAEAVDPDGMLQPLCQITTPLLNVSTPSQQHSIGIGNDSTATCDSVTPFQSQISMQQSAMGIGVETAPSTTGNMQLQGQTTARSAKERMTISTQTTPPSTPPVSTPGGIVNQADRAVECQASFPTVPSTVPLLQPKKEVICISDDETEPDIMANFNTGNIITIAPPEDDIPQNDTLNTAPERDIEDYIGFLYTYEQSYENLLWQYYGEGDDPMDHYAHLNMSIDTATNSSPDHMDSSLISPTSEADTRGRSQSMTSTGSLDKKRCNIIGTVHKVTEVDTDSERSQQSPKENPYTPGPDTESISHDADCERSTHNNTSPCHDNDNNSQVDLINTSTPLKHNNSNNKKGDATVQKCINIQPSDDAMETNGAAQDTPSKDGECPSNVGDGSRSPSPASTAAASDHNNDVNVSFDTPISSPQTPMPIGLDLEEGDLPTTSQCCPNSSTKSSQPRNASNQNGSQTNAESIPSLPSDDLNKNDQATDNAQIYNDNDAPEETSAEHATLESPVTVGENITIACTEEVVTERPTGAAESTTPSPASPCDDTSPEAVCSGIDGEDVLACSSPQPQSEEASNGSKPVGQNTSPEGETGDNLASCTTDGQDSNAGGQTNTKNAGKLTGNILHNNDEESNAITGINNTESPGSLPSIVNSHDKTGLINDSTGSVLGSGATSKETQSKESASSSDIGISDKAGVAVTSASPDSTSESVIKDTQGDTRNVIGNNDQVKSKDKDSKELASEKDINKHKDTTALKNPKECLKETTSSTTNNGIEGRKQGDGKCKSLPASPLTHKTTKDKDMDYFYQDQVGTSILFFHSFFFKFNGIFAVVFFYKHFCLLSLVLM